MDTKNLLSQSAAAAAAGCTRQNIHRAIQAAEITPVYFDGRAWVTRAELARWMKCRRKPGWPKGKKRK